MICLETLNDPVEGITLMVQAHQIFFAPVTFPRGAVLGVFFAHFYVSLLFYVPILLRPIQLLYIKLFYGCSWY